MVGGPEVVAEEEQLILPEGSAEAAAEVVVREVAERTGEVCARVDGVILDKFKRRSVKAVGAGLERHVGHGADGPAQLRFEVVGRDVDALDRLRRRDDDLQQTRPFIVIDAFDLIEIAHARNAVRLCLESALCVEELGVLKGGRRRSGDQVQERLKVAVGP